MLKANYSTFRTIGLCFQCETETVPKVPKALSRHEGFLPQLSGTADMGPGKLGESRLPASYDPAALRDDIILAICASGSFPSVGPGHQKAKSRDSVRVGSGLFHPSFRVPEGSELEL